MVGLLEGGLGVEHVLCGPGGAAACGACVAALPTSEGMGGAAAALATVFLALFTGSTTEVVWLLGCPVRQRMSPVLLSTRQQLVVSTRRLVAWKKLAPMIGKVTTARMNCQWKEGAVREAQL